MKFVSGMLPNKDHRHLMEVVKKNSSVDILTIRTVKCLGKPEDCEDLKDYPGREYTQSSEGLAEIAKRVFFQWLDTEVAKILYEQV